MELSRAAGADLTKAFIWESMVAIDAAGAIILNIMPSKPASGKLSSPPSSSRPAALTLPSSFLMPHSPNHRIPDSPLFLFTDLCKVGEFEGGWLQLVNKHHRATDPEKILDSVDRHFLFEDDFESILSGLSKLTVASTYDKIWKGFSSAAEMEERKKKVGGDVEMGG